ncbi:MAG: MOSC domain-containing protein, partial [Gemmatimonadota bacterium]
MAQKPTLVRIRIYPVKSLGGFDRDVWELDAFGLRYDRRWMIVDPDGRFMTQRDYPGMAEISVEMQADRLILSVPMQSPVAVPLEPEPGASEPVTIWDDTVAARAVSEDANRWLGEVLKTPCRLVYMPEESARSVDRAHVGRTAQVAFADGFPLLLTSEESLEELNRRLSEPVAMDRFRPNLVVSGIGGPHVEDTWRRIRVSDMELDVVKPCSRCVIVTTDQQTGERGPEPLETLATYRTFDGGVCFGQNVVHMGHGRIRVGDDIQVLETGDPVPDPETAKAGPKPEQADASEKKGKERQTGPRMWPTEPGFELYLPEEEEVEIKRDVGESEPDDRIEPDLEVESEPESDDAEPQEPVDAATKPVDDIIFPFEVDLVVTPADLKEAAQQEEAAEEEAAEEEAVEEEAAEEEVAATEDLDVENAFLEEVIAEAAAQETASKKKGKKGKKKAAAEETVA